MLTPAESFFKRTICFTSNHKSEMNIFGGCVFLKKQKCKLAHALAAIKPEHIHTLINDSSIAFYSYSDKNNQQ